MKKSNITISYPSKKELDKLLEYFQAGLYIDAEKLSLSITKEFPKHHFAWNVLGVVLKKNGKKNYP